MELAKASLDRLPAYTDALKTGWSPDNLRPEAAREQLDAASRDPQRFVATFEDLEAKGDAIVLPDGSRVPRLPGFQRWIWDDGFCGIIGLRWQPGTEELPAHCPGHVGYSVVPWRRREGLASAALVELLPEARATGLRYIEVTTSPSNIASIKVIERAGGTFVERFQRHPALGGEEALRFRIGLGCGGVERGADKRLHSA